MLSEEIREQVKTVLHARMIEDKAYRSVMGIDKNTPQEEAERIASDFEKCARMVIRQEHALASMLIREHNKEIELVSQ